MSGDPGKEQPVIFYTDEMTEAKRVLLRHHSDVVEIEGVVFQQRWRTGSCMQE